MKTHAPAPRRRQSGFALLITITLLAFLVMLLVSLAALTRVETQVASNNQQLSQARQNALMGLNVALGQIQVMLGPDTRVTAPAAQKGNGAPAYGTTDFDNNANWIGVYRQNPSVDTRDPQLLNWLVSGNQTLPVPPSGANTPPLAPNTAVTGLATNMDPTTPVTVAGRPAVLMVGPKSAVGEDTPVPAAAIDRFVVAPLEDIKIPASSLPGFASTSPSQTVGQFAYWVGDEGMKAKVNTVDPWENSNVRNATSPATTAAQAEAYRFMTAQRYGIENIFDPAGTILDAAYPAGNSMFTEALPKIVDIGQLSLATVSAEQSRLSKTLRSRFHDVTATSSSLLTNTARGGFKKDLTSWISGSTSNPVSASPDDDYIAVGDPSDNEKTWLPKWDLIRDYANTRGDASSPALAPRQQTSTQQGIYPVMTYVRIGYNLTCTAPNTPLRINVMPVVALWNPYNVKIKADTYEFCYQYTNQLAGQPVELRTHAYSGVLDPTSFNLSVISTSGKLTTNAPTSTVTYYGTGTGAGANRLTEYWRFRLIIQNDMLPGESRLCTITDASHDTVYQSGVSTMSDVAGPLTAVGTNNSVYLLGQVKIPAKYLPASIGGEGSQIAWNTLPNTPGSAMARLDILLTKPLPGMVLQSNLSAVSDFLRNNAYQKIRGIAFNWTWENEGIAIQTTNNGRAITYDRVELMMSSMPTGHPEGWSTFGMGSPRWLANFNPQAADFLRRPMPGPSPGLNATFNPSYLTQSYRNKLGATPLFEYYPIPNADSDAGVSAGTRVSNSGATPENSIIREFQPENVPLFSIAQLQHVNMSALNLNPAYTIGNSSANVYVDRDTWFKTNSSAASDFDSFTTSDEAAPTSTFPGGATTGFPNNLKFNRIYDLSYVLNGALWDGYYFSTIPSSLTAAEAANPNYRLPNSRHQFNWSTGSANTPDITELKTVDTAASRLLVDGGFNINSTSTQAWRALLASHNGLDFDPNGPPESNPEDLNTRKHPLSRFTNRVANSHNDTWIGYRVLSSAEINDLADKIVAEIRTRGPFLSLSDFVNRRLVRNNTGLKGPLQAAIDASIVNATAPFNANVAPLTNSALAAASYPRDIKPQRMDNAPIVPPPVQDVEQEIIYTGATDAAETAADPTKLAASRAAFAPGYLTQADLLTAIGPSITPRSDTFRVRSYGSTVNPVTGSVDGRAWCEAIVQRLPEYIVPASAGGDAPNVSPPTHPTNLNLGRRFKIISFRWLSSHDI